MIKRYLAALALSAALHGMVAAAISSRPVEPAATPDPLTRPVRVFVVAPTEDATLPGVKPIDRAATDWLPQDAQLLEPISVGKFKADVAKIAMHADVLFPFISPGLALDHFFPMMQTDLQRSLANPFATAREQRSKQEVRRPLLLTDSHLQAVIDKSWSRYERWNGFGEIRTLVETHNGDEGRLPALLRKYCDENALQPYADSTVRDPRLWVQLGIAADHVTFVGFIRQYVSERPSTKAAIELLFLLDTLAQASRDTLGLLLDSEPAERLTSTRTTDPRAYELLSRIREHYARELDHRGLKSRSALDAHYDAVRLAILAGIIASAPSGYRVNDARFLIGAIHWRANRRHDAFQSWRELTDNPDGSRALASSQIRRLLRDGAKQDDAIRREIEQILRNDQGRWLMSSYDRLEHFGYRIDTY